MNLHQEQAHSGFNRTRLVVLAAVFAVAGLLLLISTSANTTIATLTLQASETHIVTEQEVTVDVVLDTGGEAVNAVETNVQYDPLALEFVGVVPDSNAWDVALDSPESGLVNVVRGTTGGGVTSSNSLVFTLRFKGLTSSIDSSVSLQDSAVVRASDSSDIFGTSNVISVVVDNTAPSVSVAQPFANSVVSGSANVAFNVDDNIEIDRVEVFVDDTSVRILSSEPYSFSLDTTELSDGSHSLSAVAIDIAGNRTQSTDTVFSIDNTAPQATIVSPAAGEEVAGTVDIAVDVSDDNPVTEVVFFVDGEQIGAVQSAPYELAWDSAGATDGSHTISVRATDAPGNVSTDSSVVITVVNVVPVQVEIVTPQSGATVNGDVDVAVFTSGVESIDYVALLQDGVVVATDNTFPYAFVWDSTTLSTGSTAELVARVHAGNEEYASDAVSVVAENYINSDIDEDGTVGLIDLSILISNWKSTDTTRADINRDGVVNVFDLSRLLALWTL